MNFKKIIIVGSPNVGKSSLFNNLSGRYATVSNYPGTTVELFKAQAHIGGFACEITDTPGMYSLLPLSEEERIARLILIEDRPDAVLHVAAAKNLERTLSLTFQLIEAGLPVILVLNIMDEAGKDGIEIDIPKLEKLLGIPVVPTVSVRRRGLKELKARIAGLLKAPDENRLNDFPLKIRYPADIAAAQARIAAVLRPEHFLSRRALSLLFLLGDEEVERLIKIREDASVGIKIEEVRRAAIKKVSQPMEYLVNLALQALAREFSRKTVKIKPRKSKNISRILGEMTLKPLVGVPLLAAFLYFGIYKLVGGFGAGTVVDFLESKVFEVHINPFFISLFEKIIPWELVNSLFVGEYGIITLGIRYAIAIVLPIVGIFFFVFSFAEDTGYLPRLGAMLDRVFKKIGLSGRAVIPLILGLGCDTMATMVTRILPSKRERVIATFLLSLSVPCSAQLGVILGVLAGPGPALAIWFLVISGVFAASGFILNRILKGKQPSFHIELPPLRMP